jgi:hypothetical protein
MTSPISAKGYDYQEKIKFIVMLPHLIPLRKDWRINKMNSIGQLEYTRTLQCKMWYNYCHYNHHTNYHHIEFQPHSCFVTIKITTIHKLIIIIALSF